MVPILLTDKKCIFHILCFKDFPLIPRFRLIRIFRVLEYSVYSAFQNIQYFPCCRIFRVFRILEYSVCSAIPFHRSSIPPNRVTHSSTPASHVNASRRLVDHSTTLKDIRAWSEVVLRWHWTKIPACCFYFACHKNLAITSSSRKLLA